MRDLVLDLRYASRMLFKSWGITAIAVTTLALGIGANTAIFSVVNSVLLRPLPFEHSDRIVYLLEKLPGFSTNIPMNATDYTAFSERQQSFDELGIYDNRHFDLSGDGNPERISGARASSSVFPLLGVAPMLGRTYTQDEDHPGHALVVLSYGLWQRRFGSDQSILGKTIQLDRQPYTVIGVMPKAFEFPLRGEAWSNQPADLWVPMAFTRTELEGWGNMYNDSVIARLKPGVSLAQAQNDASRAISQVESLYPAPMIAFFKGTHVGISVTPYSQIVTGDVRLPLLVLLVAVGIVLLIACANVANLLLVRATARQKEIAVRAAMGADSWRLARQMITESTLLGVLSGVVAVFIAGWGLELMLSLAPADLPRMQEVQIDWRVLVFALTLSLATAILFGITPAIEAGRTDPQGALREGGRSGGPSRGRRKLQNALIVSQTALAVMLLIGAGLLMRSFSVLLKTDPGFRPQNVVTGTIALPLGAYSKAANVRSFWKDLLARAAVLPGVKGVGLSTDLPLNAEERDAVTIEGEEGAKGNLPNVAQSWIMGDYFGAMGITLKRGRYFTDAELSGAVQAVIISENAARIYWPAQDPIGKRMSYMGGWHTVIGVVDDVKDGSIKASASPHAYTPYLAEKDQLLETPEFDELRTLHVEVRTATDPTLIFASLRAAVASIDPQIAVDHLQTMGSMITDAIAPERFNLLLVVLFAALAIFLAAVGVYGVLSYSISQRTREFGVRIALGAQPGGVLGIAITEGMKLASLGILIGLAGGFILTRLMSSLLFGVTARDPITFAAVAVLVALVSFTACFIPARRAMRVDPIVALRYE